jgi:ketol-acid reductoisomerase
VIGYGVQGPGQALNMRDNGIAVIVGQREGTASWDKAVADGFVPGQTLFSIEEAARKATMIQYLLSDAGQVAMWPTIKAASTKATPSTFPTASRHRLQRSDRHRPPGERRRDPGGAQGLRHHGAHQLSGRQRHQLQLCRPPGPYRTGQGAHHRPGIAIGSGYLFPTTFEKEVHSDLTGERGVLMGCLAGVMEAQYNLLRKNGHSPSEAFNETVEELTQSLIRLVAQNGMDWMYANCSTTAQRGALDWAPRFRDAVAPVFEKLYESVVSGEETRRTLELQQRPGLPGAARCGTGKVIHDSEMWRAGAAVRALRPENRRK